MRIIGLTGGIASGKSTVGRLLRARGVDVIDADELAREAVSAGSAALARIVERFGAGVLCADGALDRKALGAIVFSDDQARRDLNAITHPEVARLAAERFGALANAGKDVVVYEVPLLFENGLDAMMDATILVACDEELQVRRTMGRDGLDEAAARARLAAQMPLSAKRARATIVIENDGDLGALERGLDDAWARAERSGAGSA